MPIKRVSAPAVEPVSLAEAKLHLRVDFADDDALIASLISAARAAAETICRRALISQQYKMTGDRFPSPMSGRLTEFWLGQQWGLAGMNGVSSFLPTGKTGYEILVPVNPILSIDSIKYTDPAGVQQTLNPLYYKLDDVSEPGRIVPAYGKTWPTTRQEINAVEVLFTVGYGATAASVPEPIKQWIKMRVASMYEHREEVELVARGQIHAMPFVDRLLDDFRVLSFV